MDKFYHILCTNGERVIYEGRFQCPTRTAAINLLRDKIGRRNLSGLRFTITEIPIDIIREVVESILNKKKVPEGDVVKFDTSQNIPTANGYAMIYDNKRNTKSARSASGITRRLGDL